MKSDKLIRLSQNQFFIQGHRLFNALKGHDISAQGEALGSSSSGVKQSPEGAI